MGKETGDADKWPCSGDIAMSDCFWVGHISISYLVLNLARCKCMFLRV